MEQNDGIIDFGPESEDRERLFVKEQVHEFIQFEAESEDRKKVSPEERKHEFSKAKLSAALNFTCFIDTICIYCWC